MHKSILFLVVFVMSPWVSANGMSDIDLMVREEIAAHLLKHENLTIDRDQDITNLSFVEPLDPRCDVEVAAYVGNVFRDQCNVCFSVQKNSDGKVTDVLPEITYCVE